MNIIFSVIKVVEDIEGLSKGKYLEVAINDTNIHIPYDIYLQKDIESKKIREAKDSMITIGEAEPIFDSENNNKVNNELLYFLVNESHLKIDPEISDLEVTVVAEISTILELPWESLFNNSTTVYRKLLTGNSDKLDESIPNNLAILMSHGHLGIGNDIKPFIDKEVKSMYESIYKLTGNNTLKFRIEKILLSKHTTTKSLSDIDWTKFNLLHIMAHGNKYGGIELENEEHGYYKLPVTITTEEFVDQLRSGRFKLIFISACYSAGGVSDGNSSLTYQLVKEGITQYSIGYSSGIGDKHAKSFTELFYEAFCNGNSIIKTYKMALTSYRRSYPSTDYIPYLYYA